MGNNYRSITMVGDYGYWSLVGYRYGSLFGCRFKADGLIPVAGMATGELLGLSGTGSHLVSSIRITKSLGERSGRY